MPSLTLYVIDGSRVEKAPKALEQREQSGLLSEHDALAASATLTVLVKPWGPLLWARDIPSASSTPIGDDSVQDYKFLVFTDPVSPDVERKYEYDHQQLQEVLRVPGFVSAQRFATVSASQTSTLPRYLVIFTLRSRDLAATNNEILRRSREPITVMSPTIGWGQAAFMRPLTPTAMASTR